MAQAKDNEDRKIIVDEDWKRQAQREKEQLKAQAEIEKKQKGKESQSEIPPSASLPQGDFTSLVSMIATQALFAMGLITTEKDKKPGTDLKLAKFHIDMLEALEEKTRGNLSDGEEKMLGGTLNQLRMNFVKLAE